MIEAGTDADLKTALAQLAGGVTQPLDALRDDLLNLLADVEAALDFADEDIEFVGKPDTLMRIAAALAQLTNLQRQLDDRTVRGRPVRVALVGLPNAGKSSLFNALRGRRRARQPEAGTTRDYLTQRLDLGGVRGGTDRHRRLAGRRGHDRGAGPATRPRADDARRRDPVVRRTRRVRGSGRRAAERDRRGGAAVRTKCDLASGGRKPPMSCSESCEQGADAPRSPLPPHILTVRSASRNACVPRCAECVASLARPPLAPSQSRCRHHVDACLRTPARSRIAHVAADDPPELLALGAAAALDQLGEMTGAVYTNDLLDRIFSRFCIGK